MFDFILILDFLHIIFGILLPLIIRIHKRKNLFVSIILAWGLIIIWSITWGIIIPIYFPMSMSPDAMVFLFILYGFAPASVCCLVADWILTILKFTHKRSKGRARIYFKRGKKFSQNLQFDKAIEQYSKAIALKPDYFEAYHWRALAYYSTGHYEKAIADCTMIIQLQPEDFEVSSWGVMQYKFANELDKAVNDYTEALQLKPVNPILYTLRAKIYFDKEMYQLAIDDYTTAINIGFDGNDDFIADLYYKRSLAYEKLGQTDKSQADYNKAIALSPNIIDRINNLL
ncbi:MAG: tetratricopeptide repeat protein [Phycisphaerae bacterium]|nr:tetratricopeptide repeat protein [Phycisphaerae bacterium]